MKWHVCVSVLILMCLIISLLLYPGCEENVVESPQPSQGLAQERYSDPNGFFQIIPPEGWTIEEYPQDPRGKVAFDGPSGVQLRVLAKALDYNRFEDMVSDIKEIEKSLGIDMSIETIEFLGIPAVRRNFTVEGLRILVIDFMEGNVNHDLWYSAPPNKYEDYVYIVTKSMNTYEAIPQNASAEDIQKYQIAGKLRLAQIFFEIGDYDLALQFVDEGLVIEPHNTDLLKLKVQIEAAH